MKHICETIFKWVSSICLWATKREIKKGRQTQRRKYSEYSTKEKRIHAKCVYSVQHLLFTSMRDDEYIIPDSGACNGAMSMMTMAMPKHTTWWFFSEQYFSKLFVCHFNKQILLPPEQEKQAQGGATNWESEQQLNQLNWIKEAIRETCTLNSYYYDGFFFLANRDVEQKKTNERKHWSRNRVCWFRCNKSKLHDANTHWDRRKEKNRGRNFNKRYVRPKLRKLNIAWNKKRTLGIFANDAKQYGTLLPIQT